MHPNTHTHTLTLLSLSLSQQSSSTKPIYAHCLFYKDWHILSLKSQTSQQHSQHVWNTLTEQNTSFHGKSIVKTKYRHLCDKNQQISSWVVKHVKNLQKVTFTGTGLLGQLYLVSCRDRCRQHLLSHLGKQSLELLMEKKRKFLDPLPHPGEICGQN